LRIRLVTIYCTLALSFALPPPLSGSFETLSSISSLESSSSSSPSSRVE
jgi:hypothetical protein